MAAEVILVLVLIVGLVIFSVAGLISVEIDHRQFMRRQDEILMQLQREETFIPLARHPSPGAERAARLLFRRSYPKLYDQYRRKKNFCIPSKLFPVKYWISGESKWVVDIRGREIVGMCLHIDGQGEMPLHDQLLQAAALFSEREEDVILKANCIGHSSKIFEYLKYKFPEYPKEIKNEKAKSRKTGVPKRQRPRSRDRG